MRGERWSVALAVLLAGCSGAGPGGQGGDAGTGPAGDEGGEGLQVPGWMLGDWWAYGVEAGPGGESAPTTYVITEDLGDDWWMATDSPERAFQDARDDISRLGRQRKADLAGSQGLDRVEFFQWPLTVGSTWSTKWDDQPVTVTVDEVTPQGARLTARNGTAVAYTYTYDAAARWFGELNRHGPDGQVAFTLRLLDHGAQWKGTAVAWELTELLARHQAPASPNFGLNGYPRLQVPQGTHDLWMTYRLPCDGQGGGYTLRLDPEDLQAGDAGYQDSGPCDGPVTFTGVVVEAPASATWTLALTYGSSPTPDGLDLELVARRLVETPYGL